jgi:hypothetical protein
MLLITTFVELRVLAGRCRTWSGRPHAVSGWSMLIHTCHARLCRAHAALWRGLEKSVPERLGRGMARARHGICESNTTALCKSFLARHGRGMMIWYIYFNRSWVDTRWQQYITHLHTNSTHNIEIGKLGSAGRAPSCELYPDICLTTEEKAKKPQLG